MNLLDLPHTPMYSKLRRRTLPLPSGDAYANVNRFANPIGTTPLRRLRPYGVVIAILMMMVYILTRND